VNLQLASINNPVIGIAVVASGLGDLRSNGQHLSRPFFFLKMFGDFVVPNVAVVTRTGGSNGRGWMERGGSQQIPATNVQRPSTTTVPRESE
jgi:hypothetical protein